LASAGPIQPRPQRRHALSFRRRAPIGERAAAQIGSALAIALIIAQAACSVTTSPSPTTGPSAPSATDTPVVTTSSPTASPSVSPTPTAATSGGVYAATVSGQLAPRLADLAPRVYVPNERSGDVTVIDPLTYKVIGRFRTGLYPEHITPDWDLSRLLVSNMSSSTVTVLDPNTARPVGNPISVTTPYDLYFTPDGSRTVVVNDYINPLNVKLNGLYFFDRRSWKQLGWVNIPWMGADDLDMSADGRYLLVSCEYSGMVARVDTTSMKVTGSVRVGGLPRDVRLAPDGRHFLVTNESLGGVSVVDGRTMKVTRFIRTAAGAHGLEFNRDATQVYVNNRSSGTISVVDVASLSVVATWTVGGSPDEMDLTPNGKELWISNRYNDTATVVDTVTGRVTHTIAVGAAPHGILYWPLPGTMAIGQNGNMR